MNYKPVVAGNQSNGSACIKACDDAGKARMETVPGKDYILLPVWPDDNVSSTNNINTASDGNNTNNINVVSSTVDAAGIEVNVVDPKSSIELPDDPNMPELEDIVYSDDDDEDVGAEDDMNNLDAFMPVSHTKIIQSILLGSTPFEGTQSMVVLKIEVSCKQLVEHMRSDETDIVVMVEQMND
ncbi:hypothetical protein Tco_0915522 [Tanacetum coccineum]